MRRSWKIVAAVSGPLLVAGGARIAMAQTGFQGAITFATHEQSGAPGTFTITTKGNKIRMESGDHKGAYVIDNDTHTSTMVMADQKQFVRIPNNMEYPGQSAERAQPDAAPKMTITNTGRTEVVAGVPCEVYHGTSVDNGKTTEGEACVAKGVGLDPFMMMGPMQRSRGALSPKLQAMHEVLQGGKGILKFSEIKDGKLVTVMEATKIDPTPPPDAAFQPPPDYTEVKIGMGKKPS
jgi:hypothetical protein